MRFSDFLNSIFRFVVEFSRLWQSGQNLMFFQKATNFTAKNSCLLKSEQSSGEEPKKTEYKTKKSKFISDFF